MHRSSGTNQCKQLLVGCHGKEAGGGVRDMVQLLLEDQMMGRADVIMTIRGLGDAGLQWQGLGLG